MGKKRRKKKDSTAPAVADGAAAPARPAGQRFYDVPYSAMAPRLINPELGLHNLVSRAGHNAAYEIDVTLLDAPDHRMIRSGVLLAHRVLEGRGEWFLTAPDWQPLLPKDRIELMGDADLPDGLADLIRPFRRRATLGPVAALSCDRREFALRDEEGTTLALLRDDKVTVRKGGLTTARYRELMITPIGPGLDDDQVASVDRALTQVGATPVSRLPRLIHRLGAPATGPSDLPVAAGDDLAAPFRRFVAHLVARRLRALIEADLAVRGGDGGAVGALVDEADRLRQELSALVPVLDAAWAEDLLDDLGWITGDEPGVLATRLRGERYLSLLERLVTAARTPRVARTAPAGDVLAELFEATLTRLRRTVDSLTIDSPDEVWEQAWAALTDVPRLLPVAGSSLPELGRVSDLIFEVTGVLDQILADQSAANAIRAGVGAMDAEAAFQAGQEFERQQSRTRRTRREFVRRWAKVSKKLDR